VNFVAPLLWLCLFPFNTLFLGWLAGRLSFTTLASFPFTPLPIVFASPEV